MSTHRITKRRDVVSILQANGWKLIRRGKHEVWTHPNGARPLPLGRERNGELPPGTIHQILKHVSEAQGKQGQKSPAD